MPGKRLTLNRTFTNYGFHGTDATPAVIYGYLAQNHPIRMTFIKLAYAVHHYRRAVQQRIII